MASEITHRVQDGVAVLKIDRAAKKNALTTAMYGALANALEAGEADPRVGVHMITGAPGVFCAGNDIADFMAMATGMKGSDGGAAPAAVIRFIRLLDELRKPLIAAVDGQAIGIGTTMLLHCDLVYASERAVFATPFVDLGLVPEAGSSRLLPARIGGPKAFAMFALGETLNAQEALAGGLINAVVPAETLEATALARAQSLAQKPPQAVGLTKALMRGDPDVMKLVIDAELGCFQERLASAEAREAFKAFLEKRKPDFRKA